MVCCGSSLMDCSKRELFENRLTIKRYAMSTFKLDKKNNPICGNCISACNNLMYAKNNRHKSGDRFKTMKEKLRFAIPYREDDDGVPILIDCPDDFQGYGISKQMAPPFDKQANVPQARMHEVYPTIANSFNPYWRLSAKLCKHCESVSSPNYHHGNVTTDELGIERVGYHICEFCYMHRNGMLRSGKRFDPNVRSEADERGTGDKT